jgi:hypothetical protein
MMISSLHYRKKEAKEQEPLGGTLLKARGEVATIFTLLLSLVILSSPLHSMKEPYPF